MNGIVSKLREKSDLIKELSREGFFDEEELRILRKLKILSD